MADKVMKIEVDEKVLNTFKAKTVATLNKPYHYFLRELMVAFNEGRLTIRPDDTTKEIYSDD